MVDDIDALWFYRLKPSFNEPAPVSKFLLIAFYLMQQRFTLIFCWVSTGRCSTSLDFIWSSFVSYLTGFYGVLMALTGFYRVLLGFTGFRWLLAKRAIRIRKMLIKKDLRRDASGPTGLGRHCTGFLWRPVTEFRWRRTRSLFPLPSSVLGFYRVLLDFTRFQWVLLDFIGFLLGFNGFDGVLLGFNGFDWV